MKCRNCNKDVQVTMNCCPYCGYDLINQASEYRKKETIKNWLIIIVPLLLVVVLYFFQGNNSLNTNDVSEQKPRLDDMVSSVCHNAYETVYTNSNLKNRGIYQCLNDQYVYYIHDTDSMCGYYPCGRIYEFGYTYYESVEKFFPKSIYFYRESRVVGIDDELKIALVANSEEELIDLYSEKMYEFVKDLNKTSKRDIQLMIYYNDSLSGIESTYDKLFLMVQYQANNITQSDGMGTMHGDYIFYDGNPYELLSAIFEDKDSYPTNARNALKFHRHLSMEIYDGQTITYEDFLNRLQNSFQDGY